MNRAEQIEAALSAFRFRDARGRVQPSSDWHDLDDAGRREVFERGLRARRMEAALDAEGLSSTARAVLARIPGASR